MSDETAKPQTRTPGQTVDWKKIVLEFAKPSTGRAVCQIATTLGPYALIWYLMYLSLAVSWWITLPLAVLAGAFLIRIFIIFHDCGHGSFFKSRKVNDIVGFVAGLLTFTPYHHWRWEHSIHHAHSGDLDNRGTGDVWTMTVKEYLDSSPWKRFTYRLTRNPFVLFGFAPLYVFLVEQRFPSAQANPRERRSVHWMNLAILGTAAVLSWIYGIIPYLIIQLTVMAVAGGAGIWMFYVQHQFEEVYWERGEEWDYTEAALKGSSFYKLPRILQWFTGNIGFHHIHHLSSRIPNYNLERCHHSHPLFHSVKPITLFSSLKSITLRLWDEDGKKLVGYRHLRNMRQGQARSGQS